MTNTLRDQLIKSGLAKPKAAKPKQGKSRKAKSRKKPKNSGEIDLAKAYALKDKEERKAQALSKRKKQQEDERRRRINQKIKALVTKYGVNDPEAELVRNFFYKGKIRMVRVNAEQMEALNTGKLHAVYLTGRYYLVETAIADQVRDISAEHMPDMGVGSDDSEE